MKTGTGSIRKRVFSSFLSLLLATGTGLSALPLTAFAEEEPPQIVEEPSEAVFETDQPFYAEVTEETFREEASLAEPTLPLTLRVQFAQTDARNSLAAVNAFRTGSEAWYLDVGEPVGGKRVDVPGLGELQYDYDLEKAAMIRAVECLFLQGHTRPDGSRCFTAVQNATSYSSMGENLMYGYAPGRAFYWDAVAAVESWKETNYPYDGQGHRRNMLSGDFTHIGVAGVSYNGMTVWVQEFGRRSGGTPVATAANDSMTDYTVQLPESFFSGLRIEPEMQLADPLEVVAGKTLDIGGFGVKLVINDTTANTYLSEVTPVGTSVTCQTAVENTDIASLTNGVLTGTNVGETSLQVTARWGNMQESLNRTIRVKPQLVTGITITQGTSVTVTEGETVQLSAAVLPVDAVDKTLTWTSSNTALATVSDTGLVTAKQPGTVTIRATAKDGSAVYAESRVTVKAKVIAVAGVSMDKTAATLLKGKTLQLTATVAPSNATNKAVSWRSSNTGVATVSASGLVTAKGKGTATITVTTADGSKTASCKITVTEPAAPTPAPTPVIKAGWKQDGNRWWYQYANGSYPRNKWEQLGGKWYHFDASGYMRTGWQQLGGKWYYFAGDGAMRTGWQKVSGKWYYFAGDGAMRTGWQKVGGSWYYFTGNGDMKTGWVSSGGKWYYMDPSSGAMIAGTSRNIGGKTYRFDANGICTNP